MTQSEIDSLIYSFVQSPIGRDSYVSNVVAGRILITYEDRRTGFGWIVECDIPNRVTKVRGEVKRIRLDVIADTLPAAFELMETKIINRKG